MTRESHEPSPLTLGGRGPGGWQWGQFGVFYRLIDVAFFE